MNATQTLLDDAYHNIYDVKDANHWNEDARIAAYLALAHLEDLMKTLGVPLPVRYDDPAPR